MRKRTHELALDHGAISRELAPLRRRQGVAIVQQRIDRSQVSCEVRCRTMIGRVGASVRDKGHVRRL